MNIFKWDKNTNQYGVVSYSIRNSSDEVSSFRAFVSQNPDDAKVIDPKHWVGNILTSDGGLISIPTFEEESLDEALLCAEIMLALDWDYNKWENRRMPDSPLDFLSTVCNCYIHANPYDLEFRKKVSKYIC